jgi:hypothetical protein
MSGCFYQIVKYEIQIKIADGAAVQSWGNTPLPCWFNRSFEGKGPKRAKGEQASRSEMGPLARLPHRADEAAQGASRQGWAG